MSDRQGYMIIGGVTIPVHDWECLAPVEPAPGEVLSTEIEVIDAEDPAKIGRREPTALGRQYRKGEPERN